MRLENVEVLIAKNKSARCHSARRKISGYDYRGAKQKIRDLSLPLKMTNAGTV